MNEVDLFVNLLPPDFANDLLRKKFNDNSKGNIDVIKMKLKKHLKGLGAGKVNRNKANPFISVLNSLKMDIDESLNEKEFFQLISGDSLDAPDYVKLANAILFHPDTLKEHLPTIQKNISENKPLFLLPYQFSKKEELVIFLNKAKPFYNEDISEDTIKAFTRFLTKEDDKLIQKYKKETKNMSLIDLHKTLLDIPASHDNRKMALLIQYAYLLNHHDEEIKINNGISAEIIISLADYFKEELENNMNEKETEQISKELEELSIKISTMEKQNKEKVTDFSKKYESLKNEYKEQIGIRNQSLKELEDKYNNELLSLQSSIEILSAKNKKLQDDLIKIEKKNKELKENNKELINKVNEKDVYLEYAFATDIEKQYVIIHSIDITIAKIVFPEILFISIDEIRRNPPKDKFENIKMMLIQREGLSTLDITLIEECASINNIKSKIFLAGNEKQLIERICLIKELNREGI